MHSYNSIKLTSLRLIHGKLLLKKSKE